MEGAVCKLNKAFEEKQASAALAETRIKVRNQRPPSELIKYAKNFNNIAWPLKDVIILYFVNDRDAVQRRLVLECQELNESMARINAKIIQAKNSLRNLQRNQLELEDAINVKTNSINVDECKVMPLRRTISIQEY